MNPLNTAAAKPLRADLAVDRSGGTGPGAASVAFAGLLDEQQQRWSKPGGESSAYDGSAFDVAPARRESARPAAPPTSSPARVPEATAQAASSGERQAARPASSAGAPNKAPQKTAESRRDAGPAEGADGAHAEAAAGVAPSDGATPARAGAAADADEPTPEAQALIDWMARWSTPAADAGLAGGAPLPGAAGAAAAAAGVAPTNAAATGTAAAAALFASDDAAAALATGGEAGGLSPAAALAEPAGAQAAPPVLAPQGAAAPLVQANGPATSIVLPTPVDSPDFSQALASQLTTLARHGVHEAQLQLNPADMGPISVQITLDGSQAQIDFAATQARTREALEAAWPALAASLHSAGLTLGGGGVSDQRSGARDGGATPGRGVAAVPGAGDDGGPAASRSVRIDAQRGLLDLYA